MPHKTYSKPALTAQQQVEFLARNGLFIENESSAQHALSVIGYYRFSAYLLPFKESHQESTPRTFKAGTTFEQVLNLYLFDRELKRLVNEGIEQIEIAFRTAITNITAVEINPFWYTERTFYKDTKPFENLMRDVNQIIKNKPELFIEHYYANYNNPPFPPIWMVMETLSFGACSKLFSNLKQVGLKKKICEGFGIAPTIMDSWLKTLVYVRNICAHHGRLWNRWLVEAPIIPKTELYHATLQQNNRRFIVCAYVINYLLSTIIPETKWLDKLHQLFSQNQHLVGASMGFSQDWEINFFG